MMIGMGVEYVHPAGMLKSPAFSQAVVVNNPAKTIYVGAQMPQDSTGALVGKGDMRAQTVQVLANLKTVLEACGAGVEHVIQWTIYVVPGHDIMPAVEEAMRWLAGRTDPPLNTVVSVPGFPGSEALLSIEAVAVL
jgi:enamine deaminase RidA (YjgF/YER057c/UK114 family)